jgi:hypothetical protein
MDWDPDFATSYKFIPRGTIVNGTPLAADFNPGATVDMTVTTRDRVGSTHTAYVDDVFKRGPWSIDANLNGSRSRGSYSDLPNGHFSELETSLTLGQLAFRNIREGIPDRIELADRGGAPLDWTDLTRWNAPAITAKSGQTESLDQYTNFKVNLRRDLDFIPWPPTRVTSSIHHATRLDSTKPESCPPTHVTSTGRSSGSTVFSG